MCHYCKVYSLALDIKLTEIINMKQSNVIKGGNLLAAPEKNANFAPQRA